MPPSFNTVSELRPFHNGGQANLGPVKAHLVMGLKIMALTLQNTLHSTFYDGTSGVRGNIDKILGCYNKIKTIDMDFNSDYVVWLIMGTLPL